jgi:replicative DNA helicase
MAAIEFRILSKLLRDGSLQEAIKQGLTQDQFQDAEARQIWRFLHRHWFNRATAKTLPSVAAVQDKWRSFQLTADYSSEDSEDAKLPALIHDMKMKSFESDARALASYFQELVDADPHDAVRAMQGHLNDLVRSLNSSEQIGVGELVETALEHYESAQEGTVYGIPWPWDVLTHDTLGKRPGDFIVFYARMKQMKTWLMLYCAVYDYMVNNARIIIWSREMNKAKMSLRIAALMARVDYQLFKKGKLPPKMQAKAYSVLNALRNEDYIANVDPEQRAEDARLGKRQMLLLCGRDAPVELEALTSTIHDFCPDVVYLDSFYHMQTRKKQSTQRWQRIAELAEDVKSMAEDENIPVIAVHQANRLGEKTHGNTMADMSDSDVIAREADLIIRVIKRRGKELYEADYEQEIERIKREEEAESRWSAPQDSPRTGRRIRLPGKVEDVVAKQEAEADLDDDDAPRVGAELALVLPGNREGILDAFTVNAVPGYNFEFISSDYSLDEIEDWVKADESSKPNKAASRKPEKPQFSSGTFKNYRGKSE